MNIKRELIETLNDKEISDLKTEVALLNACLSNLGDEADDCETFSRRNLFRRSFSRKVGFFGRSFSIKVGFYGRSFSRKVDFFIRSFSLRNLSRRSFFLRK